MKGWPGRRRILIYLGTFGFALLCGLIASFTFERLAYRECVVRGVSLDGRPVTGMNRKQLVAALQASRSSLGDSLLELSLEGKRKKIRAAELGLALDVEAMVRQSLDTGHRGSVLSRFGTWLTLLVSKRNIPSSFSVDREKLRKALLPWAAELLDEPVLPVVTFDGEVVTRPGRGGTVIEYEQLAQLLRREARAPGLEAISVPTRKRAPLISDQEVNRVRREAETLVGGPVEVLGPGEALRKVLAPNSLGAAVGSRVDEGNGTFSLQLDMGSLRGSLESLLREVEKEPVEATFEFSATGAPSITPSQSGKILDESAFHRLLLDVARGGPRSIELPLEVREPDLTSEEAEKLGVKGLVMSFTTRHACCQPRVENIHHAARKLDGVVLRPGQKFSLNEFLGPRRRESGYHKAPTIVQGEMEDVYGGGISQLATTLFNAVLRGGYEIIQRQPHSVYFSRYPEGHEATVSFPEPDLIFRNDTEAGMVIKTQAESTYIRVLIFGDNGGRVTTVDKGRRYDIVEPPKEYEPDETMPPEKMKRLVAGQLGWKVLVSRKVRFPNGKVKEEKREVVYNPRPELLRVHPCVIPEGEKGHTGEECPEPEIIEEEEELSEDVYYETL